MTLPRPHVLEVENPALDVRREHPMLEPLHRRQRLGRDLVEPPQVSRQRVHLTLDRLATLVLEEVVVRVHAVEGGVGRVALVKIGEQIVDEMRQRFRNDHRVTGLFSLPAVAICQWYNKPLVRCPALCSWSPRLSATSKTLRGGPCPSCARRRLSPPRLRGERRRCSRD